MTDRKLYEGNIVVPCIIPSVAENLVNNGKALRTRACLADDTTIQLPVEGFNLAEDEVVYTIEYTILYQHASVSMFTIYDQLS